ncbi:CDP-diacylglycerol---serine O-phosphatidyltransferase [Mameliella alba]|uniref:CDP-diacylglycerol--serine O-phosphatidyltransferase n=1 Tax=Mameliella alba TaxID=561184 RepID=UPI0008903A1E|nr:CDP-diacylglycerol--serine O-phosphatidyltransferase [Mameliella alba]OWV50287.1 CDP-diacylglycerol--serine O-phosphatidyltransferase [Mameliella alba]PTR42314.1 CDP-diacylglycerol--serine O-phosphatidyltransferase [Mameliella alba]GGF56766.1 CDP-diacylglycerol--serine O-phosphatidyltransferase [Mameliella alba]SDC05767.1 CDP-diacylglycerol---serine O-phosphatidyltransferase [Mameliella alba]
MPHPLPDKRKKINVLQLLPNLVTISAICAGLSAIRFGYEGNFELAVRLVLVACVLDGLDGRLARLTKSESPIGAELDSLADFLNFGVAPVLIMYQWALQDFQSAGWIAVLSYSICCVLRLARFNVDSRMDKEDTGCGYFVGVPSPAGAVLVLLPMVISFLFSDLPLAAPSVIAGHVFLVGLLMISRIPTYSFKQLSIDRGNAKFFLLGAGLMAAALLTYLWATLALMTFAYICSLIWAFRSARKSRNTKD